MMQRQLMFKQLQEIRQQQQLQELGDVRQQSYMNQLSFLGKQSSAGLQSPLVNGVPLHDVSQKFMVGNTQLAQHGTSSILEEFPNGLVFPQVQSQATCSMGILAQQPDVSLYGTPISNSGNNLSRYLPGVSHDSSNILTRGNNNQMEIPAIQQSTVNNSFLVEQFNASADQVCMLDGTFVPRNIFQQKNFFGQVHGPISNDGVLPLNSQQVHSLQRNALMKESGIRQEQPCWQVMSPGKTPKLGFSQDTASLDPLEEKILFNTDENPWESGLSRHVNMGLGGFQSTQEHVDFGGLFSSNQSGSWSALMQSAVAEASSSDTAQQEEWSGLTFQNPDVSADNQLTNYIGNGKQQSSWVDNNMHSVSSPTSKPEVLFQNPNVNFSFPGFLQSNYPVSKPREGMHSDSSHESIQHSPNNATKWFDCNSQQKQPIEECKLVQTSSPFQSVWRDQRFDHSENGRQASKSPYTIGSQPGNDLAGQELRENLWLHQNRPEPVVGGGQRLSDQVHSPGTQRNLRAAEEMPPKNNVDSVAALFYSSADLCGQSIIGHTRDDKSEEERNGTHLGSRDFVPSSQVLQGGSSGDQPYNKSSSVSQGFGLKLVPAFQQMAQSDSSLNSPFPGNSSATTMSGPLYMGNHLLNQQLHVTPVGNQTPHAALSGITSRFQSSVGTSQGSSDLFQTNLRGQEIPTLDAASGTHPSLVPGVLQQIGFSMGHPNMSMHVPSRQHLLQSEVPYTSLNSLPSPDSTNSNGETAIGKPNEQHKQNSFQMGNNPNESNVQGGTTQGFGYKENLASHSRGVRGQESVAKQLSEANTMNSSSLMTTTEIQGFDRGLQRENNSGKLPERDVQTFGHSFGPSHGIQQEFSLLRQVRYLKNLEAGQGNKVMVKSNEVESGLNFHANANARQLLYYGQKLGIGNLVHNELNLKSELNSFSSKDNKSFSCSSEAGGYQPGKDSAKAFIQDSQGTVMSSQSDAHNHSKEQSQVNVQMAPSWFKHFGNFKNGQMLPMYDVRGAKDAGRQFSMGKLFENFQAISSIGQVNNTYASQQSSVLPTSATKQAAHKLLSPPYLLPSDDTEQNLPVLRPKKRKVAAYDFLPWHKEATQGLRPLQKISSMAESEWALASNRLTEKVREEAEINEDVLPVSRAKKRLVLTTQLMQHVLWPAPGVILSADAYSNSESMLYFVCRLALGDACSLTNDSHVQLLTSGMSSKKVTTSEKRKDFSKNVESFIDRAKSLESDLLRLDKTASIIDIKMDSQELEKFSVINRFAKFHSRGNIVSADTSAASGATPAVPRAFPQRYVVAHPMPKMVPEGINCLSL